MQRVRLVWSTEFLSRFKRLHTYLEKNEIDVAIITDPKNVYYFTGYVNVSVVPLPTYLIAFREDEPILLTGITETTAASKKFGGRIETFTNYDLHERMLAYSDLAASRIRSLIRNRRIRKVGLEFWNAPEVVRHAVIGNGKARRLLDLSEVILAWRRTKYPDEIEAIRASCELVDYGYGVIKEILCDGLTELEAYAQSYCKLIAKANSPSFQFFYGDFASGERALEGGGPPTNRVMRRGETFILDLWATTKGYWADTCRTFVIGREPSPAQKRIRDLLERALTIGREKLRPGNSAAEVYQSIFDVIREAGYAKHFTHHGGHCVGLDAWEPPFIIPGSDELLKENEVCALEPGVYLPEVGGIRIENDYVVTSSGGKPLSKFPLDL